MSGDEVGETFDGMSIDQMKRTLSGYEAEDKLSVDPFKLVEAFHRKFGLEYTKGPRGLDVKMYEFRRNFMAEEFQEYVSAYIAGDLEGQLDALVDLVYVVLGTAYLHGFDFNEAFRRVHAANMRKVRAQTEGESKRASALDVVKPEGWVRADLKDLVVWKVDDDANNGETYVEDEGKTFLTLGDHSPRRP